MASILPDDARLASHAPPGPPPPAPPAVPPRPHPHPPVFTLSACLAGSRRGWTVQRQADFIGRLAETGSVMGASVTVGMSRKSAYRLRALPGAESFVAAWDAALGAPVRKVTPPALEFAAYEDLVRLVMFRGRYRSWWQEPDTSALLRLLRQIDRHSEQSDTATPGW